MKQKFLRTLIVMMILAEGVFANAQAPGPGPRRAGGFNGGGGYSALCNDGKHYALDYKASRGAYGVNLAPQLESARSVDEIFALILKTLDEKLYEASVDFKDFLQFNENPQMSGTVRSRYVRARRVWTDGTSSLGLNGDHQTLRVPGECLNGQGQLNLRQLIVRIEAPDAKSYDPERVVMYDRYKPALEDLETNHPVQVSFAYVHEWLRDYTDDAITIMKVNAFLHSEKFFTMPKELVPDYLAGLGFRFPDNGRSAVSELRSLHDNQKMIIDWDGKWGTSGMLDSASKLKVVGQICAIDDEDRYRMPTFVFCEEIYASLEFKPEYPYSAASIWQNIWEKKRPYSELKASDILNNRQSVKVTGQQILEIVRKWQNEGKWKAHYGLQFLFQLVEMDQNVARLNADTGKLTPDRASSLGIERARVSVPLAVLSQGAEWVSGGELISGYVRRHSKPFTLPQTLSSASCSSFAGGCARAERTNLTLDLWIDPIGGFSRFSIK